MLIAAILITTVDSLVMSRQALAVAWNGAQVFRFAALSHLLAVAFLVVVSAVVWLPCRLFYHRGSRHRSPAMLAAASASALLPWALAVYPVNYYLLPGLFFRKSMIANGLMLIALVPLTWIGYRLFSRLLVASPSIRWAAVSIAGLGCAVALVGAAIDTDVPLQRLSAQEGFNGARAPNIILITIDTLRADHLSCHGYERIDTPNFDRLANDSLFFRNAFATSSWTTPSMMTMMTGLYPSVHGCIDFVHRAPTSVVTLAEVLQANGYATHAVITNKQLSHKFGFARGFDSYHEYGEIGLARAFSETRLYALAQAVSYSFLEGVGWFPTTTEWTTSHVERAMKSATEPYFLWAHYLDPHGPYTPPEQHIPDAWESAEESWRWLQESGLSRYDTVYAMPENRDSVRNLYDGEVLYVDAQIGRILDQLQAAESYDKTVVALSADHGEEFWDRGGYGHGHSLHPELLHVPLMLKTVGSTGGRVIDRPVALRNMAATLIELAGLRQVPAIGANSLTRSGGEPEDLFFENVTWNPTLAKVHSGNFALISDTLRQIDQLYDLDTDPDEESDLAALDPERVADLKRRLAQWREQQQRERDNLGQASTFVLDAEHLERLRGLGYIESSSEPKPPGP